MDILEINVAVNGSTKIVISAKNDLGREVLKSIKPGNSVVEITSDVTQIMGKPIPEGSIIITTTE